MADAYDASDPWHCPARLASDLSVKRVKNGPTAGRTVGRSGDFGGSNLLWSKPPIPSGFSPEFYRMDGMGRSGRSRGESSSEDANLTCLRRRIPICFQFELNSLVFFTAGCVTRQSQIRLDMLLPRALPSAKNPARLKLNLKAHWNYRNESGSAEALLKWSPPFSSLGWRHGSDQQRPPSTSPRA